MRGILEENVATKTFPFVCKKISDKLFLTSTSVPENPALNIFVLSDSNISIPSSPILAILKKSIPSVYPG
jgi:hypothetical protein